ncbi:hypothetical protein D1O30_20110 [Methylocystis hirsuta]|uniref:Uncharacterized protein n=1 Tax=Methylocystis hirsuta TaxID=369798 RepID=A0A3M9XKH1_9HYPH|nr:hypothetical protein D1O30_20110 [Methylocystis hirsuta]
MAAFAENLETRSGHGSLGQNIVDCSGVRFAPAFDESEEEVLTLGAVFAEEQSEIFDGFQSRVASTALSVALDRQS